MVVKVYFDLNITIITITIYGSYVGKYFPNTYNHLKQLIYLLYTCNENIRIEVVPFAKNDNMVNVKLLCKAIILGLK